MRKGIFPDFGNRVGDGHVCQAVAVLERIRTDRSDRTGDGNARQAGTSIERIVTDSGDGAGNDGLLTTCYQCIACRLDNGIAVVAGIVMRVAARHGEACQIDT